LKNYGSGPEQGERRQRRIQKRGAGEGAAVEEERREER